MNRAAKGTKGPARYRLGGGGAQDAKEDDPLNATR